MTLDPRVQELLELYPDDLTDEELAELRALAEQDPAIEDLLDAILMTDAALSGTPQGDAELSDSGRKKLADRLEDSGITAWSTGGATPSGSVDEGPKSWSTGGATPSGNVIEGPKSWSTGGATPSGNVVEGPKSWSTGGATPSGSSDGGPKAWSTGGATPSGSVNGPPPGVVDLSKRRRMRQNPGFMAIAALLLIGAAFVVRDGLRPPTVGPDFTFKGDGTEGSIRGSLFVRGDTRLADGDTQPTDAPITFRAVMSDPASLALLETQDGRTFVLYPPPKEEWRVEPGTHLLQPGGQTAQYRPGSAGEARYTLLARDGPFDIPPDREVKSPEAFGQAHEGAYGLDELIVRWEGPAP
jgi:hypothetical protein